MPKIEKYITLFSILLFFTFVICFNIYIYLNVGLSSEEIIFSILGVEKIKEGGVFMILAIFPYIGIIYFSHQYFVNHVNVGSIYVLIRKNNLFSWTSHLFLQIFIRIFAMLSLVAFGIVFIVMLLQGINNLTYILTICLRYVVSGSLCLYILSMIVNLFSLKVGSNISLISTIILYTFVLLGFSNFYEAPTSFSYLFLIIPCQFISLQYHYITQSLLILLGAFIICNFLIFSFINKLSISNQIKK